MRTERIKTGFTAEEEEQKDQKLSKEDAVFDFYAPKNAMPSTREERDRKRRRKTSDDAV